MRMCTVRMPLRFEWHPAENVANDRNHGVSFEEAQPVSYDDEAVMIDDPNHSKEEHRFVLLGMSNLLRVLLVSHCARDEVDRCRWLGELVRSGWAGSVAHRDDSFGWVGLAATLRREVVMVARSPWRSSRTSSKARAKRRGASQQDAFALTCHGVASFAVVRFTRKLIERSSNS
jgi:uncharacterized protein